MENTKVQLTSNENIAKIQADNAKELANIQAQNALDQITTSAEFGGGKPSLTAAQAASAIKNGEKSQSVIDAYNYYYGTNYTVDNPPDITSSGTSAPLSDKEVKAWVDYLNKSMSDKYGSKYKALTQAGVNQYKRADADADYIIIRVFNSNELTQEQKEYLLYDKFGITEDQVNNAIKDRHYK